MNSSYYSVGRYQLTEADLIAIAIGLLIWLLAWLAFVSKIGYRGKMRWYFVLSSLIPFLCGINFLVLAFVQSPVERELKELKKQMKLKSL
jgi:ABC-type methionine transport system permease subunit